MTAEGQLVLFKFPQTDQLAGKLRPALVLRQLPTQYNDWLICMISSQLDQKLPDLDEVITLDDPDFSDSGLKLPSVIRVCRLDCSEWRYSYWKNRSDQQSSSGAHKTKSFSMDTRNITDRY